MKTEHLRAVIVKVTQGDKVVISQAYGESMTGVPATTAMHFRNGAVAFAYLGTLLMQFVDEHKVKLDDTIERWMPTLPQANKVTLQMLANQTSGYPDFETDPKFLAAFEADPFHIFTFEERLKIAFSRPMMFDPGTNWSYAHTNFMILGGVLSKIGGKPLDVLLREKVLVPMGLKNTTASQTSEMPGPVLHAFDSERRTVLKIPADIGFYEETTFWNAQWGTPIGANQTTNIDDMITTAVKVGTGALISKSSYEAMTGPHLLGFGKKQDNCAPSCVTQVNGYNYGLGIVRSGSWLLQNPLLDGYSATKRTCPRRRLPSPWQRPSPPKHSIRRGTTRTPVTRYSDRSVPTWRRTMHLRFRKKADHSRALFCSGGGVSRNLLWGAFSWLSRPARLNPADAATSDREIAQSHDQELAIRNQARSPAPRGTRPAQDYRARRFDGRDPRIFSSVRAPGPRRCTSSRERKSSEKSSA